MITKSTFQFLNDLKNNNNRPWFNENKDRYLAAQASVIEFVDMLIAEMKKHDNIENESGKKTLYRIYRDIRFSKDKTPYKSRFAGYLKRSTKLLRGGYYFSIEPGNTIIAGGFWGPNSVDIKRIRDEISVDDKPFRKIVNSKGFKDNFGSLIGETVKTAPRGFTKDHQAIDLLRYKQFLVKKTFSDKDVMGDNFLNEVVETFNAMRPFFNYMSDVLTTDSNGVPIYH